MRSLVRPKEPREWSAIVAQARLDVESELARGGELEFGGRDHWRRFKSCFADPETQISRCAYCEVSLEGDRYRGDVEHYRPKVMVCDRSFYQRKGKLVRGSKNRSGPGYYWLAYEWSNLLPVCSVCNRAKANFFPVQGARGKRTLSKGCEATERPLLLNPFDDLHPEKHLQFGRLGDIFRAVQGAPGGVREDARGRETIEICDLDRDALRREREMIAQRAHDDIWAFLAAAEAEDIKVMKALRRGLLQAMSAGSPYSGMVRIIFYQITRQHWSALGPIPGAKSGQMPSTHPSA